VHEHAVNRQRGDATVPSKAGSRMYEPDPDKPVMRIGAVADLLGVCVRTVRIYEEKGLVSPARRRNQRLYSINDVSWLGRLRQLVNEDGYDLQDLRRLVELPACWLLRGCPQDVRVACNVPQAPGKRCWEIMKGHGACAECRNCQIYRIANEKRRVNNDGGNS